MSPGAVRGIAALIGVELVLSVALSSALPIVLAVRDQRRGRSRRAPHAALIT